MLERSCPAPIEQRREVSWPNVPVFVTSLDQTELRIYWGFPTFQRSTYRIMDKIRYVSQRVNGAKRRLDAAQERGEIRTSGDKAFEA